jgi:hypothetical protein
VVHLLNSSGNNSSLLVVVGEAQHREGLTSSGLAIAHDGAIVAGDDTLHNGGGRQVIDIILGGVVQNVVKLEFPVVQLIVHGSVVRLVAMHQEFLKTLRQKLNLLLYSY